MLARSNRLVKTKDIEQTFKQGKSFYGKNLGIKVKSNKLELSRFAIIVSSKISKKAVERNIIKRRLREILRLENKYLKVGYDLIIVTLPTILGAKQVEIKKELITTLQRAKLYQ
jgi:ribonuclease P protein component